MSADELRLTESQKRAIRTTDCSLLVSAAAGSGKTAVLSERCAYLVCDAPQKCDVDELLVLTFTEAAAAEMRGRIQASLRKRMEGSSSPSNELQRQIALCEHAQISTIHSFCGRLLRQHFNEAGIDPQFSVIDSDEAKLLRREVARRMFDDCFENDADRRFRDFLDDYADGREEHLIELVVQNAEILNSLQSPHEWLKDAVARMREAAEKPLNQSQMGRELLEQIARAIQLSRRRCNSAIAAIQALGAFDPYVKCIREWCGTFDDWEAMLAKKGLDAVVAAYRDFEIGRTSPVKATVPNKDRAKAQYDSARNLLKAGEVGRLLAFTEAQWRAGQAQVSRHAELFAELLTEFQSRYSQAKKDARGLDFSDMERMALSILREGGGQGASRELSPSLVAYECQRQFRHVLVDEYQDVNEIQDAILYLVSAESGGGRFGKRPNLFAVGDVKQSIYRFRLAEPKRFLEREKRFRDPKNGIGKVIDLQENFRSRAPLLDAINQVFLRLMTLEAAEIDYSKGHELRPPAVSKFPAVDQNERYLGAPIEMHVLPKLTPGSGDEADESETDAIEIEATLCARRILEITGNAGLAPMWIEDHPAHFGDIAILLRATRHKAQSYSRVLRDHGIAVHNPAGSGFFDATEVQDMLSLLSLLDNQRQDIPLAAYLRSPMARLDEAEESLARVRLAFTNPHQRLPTPLASDDQERLPFHQAVVRYATEKDDELAAKLRAILSRLSRWRDLARQRPLAELIWTILDETAYLTFVAGLQDGEQRVANLLNLHQRARQFGSFLKQGLHRFMRFLSKLKDEADLSPPSLSDENQKAVRIMSVHGSKGLQFPIVLLPDLGKRFNTQDSSGRLLLDRRGGLGLSVVDGVKRIQYPSLSWRLTQSSLKRQTLAEEMRLLYVAMTRAEEHLILIGSAKESAPAAWAADYSRFTGALDSEEILSAITSLDWLGPVAAACGETVLNMTAHAAEAVKSWSLPGKSKPRDEDRMQRCAELQPLEMTAGTNVSAATNRLEFVYPYTEQTRLQATRSVTELTHETGAFARAGTVIELPLPQFLSVRPMASLSATEVGSATHLVLEHFDFAAECDAADIDRQMEGLLSRGVLSKVQAAAVDRSSIQWMMSTELGAMLRKAAGRLWRELPFAAAAIVENVPSPYPSPSVPGEGTRPEAPRNSLNHLDAPMIRGRIDLLVPTDGGVAVVDYKTDRVTAEQVNERAMSYVGQVQTYRQSLERIARQRVSGVYLVFLHPRVVWKSELLPF